MHRRAIEYDARISKGEWVYSWQSEVLVSGNVSALRLNVFGLVR